VVADIKGTGGGGGIVYVDNVSVLFIYDAEHTSSFPLKKGQTVKTRATYGEYTLRVYSTY
jgi:hypothetical protein